MLAIFGSLRTLYAASRDIQEPRLDRIERGEHHRVAQAQVNGSAPGYLDRSSVKTGIVRVVFFLYSLN